MRPAIGATDWAVRVRFLGAFADHARSDSGPEAERDLHAATAALEALSATDGALPTAIQNAARTLSTDAIRVREVLSSASPHQAANCVLWDELVRGVAGNGLAIATEAAFRRADEEWAELRSRLIRGVSRGDPPAGLRSELVTFIEGWGPRPEAIHMLLQLCLSPRNPDLELGRRWGKRRVEIYPDDPDAALDFALVELASGQSSKALALARRGCVEHGEHRGLQLLHIESAAACGQLQEARAAVAQAEREGLGDEAVIRWARGLIRLHATELAVAVLRGWIAKHARPPDLEARINEEPLLAGIARRVVPPAPQGRRERFGPWFLGLPYRDRQFIMVVQESMRGPDYLCFSSMGSDVPPSTANLVAPVSQVRRVPATAASQVLVFPPGNPLYGRVYAGHPRRPPVYIPLADFHRVLFQEKYNELLSLLSALGAVSIRIHFVRGYRVGAQAGGGLSAAVAAELRAETNLAECARTEGTLQAHFKPVGEPHLPESTVWYPFEDTWQRIAEARLRHGLRDIDVELRYGEDYGVTCEVALMLANMGLQLGGEFRKHEETIWRFVGEFA